MRRTTENQPQGPDFVEAPDLAPADFCDPVIEAYKKDVDRTLLRENLKLTVEQRLLKAQRLHERIEARKQACATAGLARGKRTAVFRLARPIPIPSPKERGQQA